MDSSQLSVWWEIIKLILYAEKEMQKETSCLVSGRFTSCMCSSAQQLSYLCRPDDNINKVLLASCIHPGCKSRLCKGKQVLCMRREILHFLNRGFVNFCRDKACLQWRWKYLVLYYYKFKYHVYYFFKFFLLHLMSFFYLYHIYCLLLQVKFVFTCSTVIVT